MPKITSVLSVSAGSYAKRALESFAAEESGDFVLFGGMAIELAVKAKLAKEDLMFLAASGKENFKAQVELHRSGGEMALLSSAMKSVGAVEAIDRLCLLEPELREAVEPAKEIVALRNSQAHLGGYDETGRRRVIVSFLKAIQALLQITPEEFWAPHFGLVQATLDEDSEEVQRHVQERMVAARVAFEVGVDSLPEGQKTVLYGALENRVQAQVDNADSLVGECPVCEWPSIISGATEQTDWDVDYDEEGNAESASPVLTFFAGIIECETCGLILDGEDELAAADQATSWPNENIDIDEWIEENLVGDL